MPAGAASGTVRPVGRLAQPFVGGVLFRRMMQRQIMLPCSSSSTPSVTRFTCWFMHRPMRRQEIATRQQRSRAGGANGA
ncbi:hypothetical protein GCM10010512_00330 [Streptomyces thermoviolaceus subsp. thermoviolaceus]|nr:hypothetical protein GCM10010512_00330 [Streptomyces thermoviolaceus subsp. thermoviolaceus]